MRAVQLFPQSRGSMSTKLLVVPCLVSNDSTSAPWARKWRGCCSACFAALIWGLTLLLLCSLCSVESELARLYFSPKQLFPLYWVVVSGEPPRYQS